MPDNNSAFIQRVVSGVLGTATIVSLSYFGGRMGLELVCVAVVILAIREYSRMVFPHCQMPKTVGWFYWLICVGLFCGLFVFTERGFMAVGLAQVIYMAGALWLARGKTDNEHLLEGIALGSFGILYCVMLPAFAVKLVLLNDGTEWFFFLLLVVFFGDIFAYFGGRWFGRTKMMIQVSPNKTWEGAGSGLIGSSFAGLVYASLNFPDISWYKILLFCVLCGMVAQSGDLLISLVKRVAHVKDSGHLMPGHGGILDRVDGIFIACPIVYAFSQFINSI